MKIKLKDLLKVIPDKQKIHIYNINIKDIIIYYGLKRSFLNDKKHKKDIKILLNMDVINIINNDKYLSIYLK